MKNTELRHLFEDDRIRECLAKLNDSLKVHGSNISGVLKEYDEISDAIRIYNYDLSVFIGDRKHDGSDADFELRCARRDIAGFEKGSRNALSREFGRILIDLERSGKMADDAREIYARQLSPLLDSFSTYLAQEVGVFEVTKGTWLGVKGKKSK